MTPTPTDVPSPRGDCASAFARYVAQLTAARSLGKLATRCVSELQELVPSSATSLDLVDSTGQMGETLAATGVSDYFLARYEQVGRRADPILHSALVDQRTVDNRALMSPDRWCSLPVYRDVFSLHRLTNVAYAPVVAHGQVVATIDVGRDDTLGPFSEQELDLVQAVAATVGAAYAALTERERLIRERDLLSAALDICDEPVVATDAEGGHRHLNVAARRLLARLDRHGPGLDELLPRSSTGARSLVAERTVRLADGRSTMLACRSALVEGSPGVLISFPRLLEPADECLGEVVESVLTPRERDVARLVARGLRDAEVADALALSPHTVKQHLKSIYRKVGVRSRVALARLARSEPERGA
jgi:DNA-binding CsgD family transcriptional regulator/GAF domain-containing protein